jgi:GMP synthase-like glutamine amidotransferase
VSFEDAANIGKWAELRGHTLTYTHLYHHEPLLPLESFDMLAVMGGPMNVCEHDEYPWLAAEKEFIGKAIDAEKKVIGVCLGAQLLADVLGGAVTANAQKEIGWHTVKQTPQAAHSKAFSALPREMTVFQWHGDTFSIPPGAVHLASSEACGNQAFQYGDNILGLQFHMEYSEESIEKMLKYCAHELVDAPYIQTPEQIRAGYDNIPRNTAWLYTLLDTFVDDISF